MTRKSAGTSRRCLALGALSLGFLFALEFNQVYDSDTFWQIELGRRMWAEGKIAERDSFTYTHEGERVPSVGWLAQAGFAAIYQMGGWRLLRLVHHAMIIGALLIASNTAAARRSGPLAASLAMTIAFIALLHNVHLRPQSVSLIGFAAVLWIARTEGRTWVRLALAFVVGVIWQNCHLSLAVGVVALAALATADTWTSCRSAGRLRLPWASWGFVGVLSLAQFATPLGASFTRVMVDNLYVSRHMMQIGEWLPPWDRHVLRALSPFWMLLGATLLAAPRLIKGTDPRDLALLLVMTMVSLAATRFVMLWAISSVLLWSVWIERTWPRSLLGWLRRESRAAIHPALATTFGVAALATIVAAHPAARASIVHADLPVDGIRELRRLLPGPARIYNDYVWAGPILLESPRSWRVTIDGRLYCYRDPREWARREIEAAGLIPLDRLESRHQIDAMVLNRWYHRGLIQQVELSSRWRRLYEGPACVIFFRADRVAPENGNADAIEPHDGDRVNGGSTAQRIGRRAEVSRSTGRGVRLAGAEARVPGFVLFQQRGAARILAVFGRPRA